MAEVSSTGTTSSKGGSKEPTKYVSYWMTRETRGGVLSDKIEIWLVKPERLRFGDGDVMWLAPAGSVAGSASYYGEWTIEEAKRQVGNGVPDNDRECTHVGPYEDDPIS